MGRIRYLCLLAFASLFIFATSHLFGSTFRVSPMKIEFSGHRATAILQIANEGDLPVTIQIEVLGWVQQGLTESHPETDDIFFSPPIVKIAPHGIQLVRVALRHNEHLGVEKSDRLYIEEVPGTEKSTTTGIHTVLRIGIPIYRKPANPAAASRLTWAANYTDDGALRITASNSGEVHTVIGSIAVSANGGTLVVEDSAQCVLAGGEREWILRDQHLQHADQLTLDAVTEGGKLHVEITPQSK